jgi:hypothetical protein
MAAIVAGDILWKFSTTSGSAGNSTAGTNAGLGKYISTSAWAGGAINDLFDDLTGAQNAASQVDYRCLFIHNTNTANAYQNAAVWLSSEVAGGASIAIGVDTTAASLVGSAAAQALTIGSLTTAPAGVTFASPTTYAAALIAVPLGTIPVGSCRAIWVKRSAANTAALSGDGVTLAVQGDTGSL